MKRIQSKDHNKDCIELIKFLCPFTMIKSIYLNTNIGGYHIFMNLLINHLKIILSNTGNLF